MIYAHAALNCARLRTKAAHKNKKMLKKIRKIEYKVAKRILEARCK